MECFKAKAELFPDIDTLKDNEADIAELKRRMQVAWREVKNSLVLRLVESVPRRIEACRKAKGWYTKY